MNTELNARVREIMGTNLALDNLPPLEHMLDWLDKQPEVQEFYVSGPLGEFYTTVYWASDPEVDWASCDRYPTRSIAVAYAILAIDTRRRAEVEPADRPYYEVLTDAIEMIATMPGGKQMMDAKVAAALALDEIITKGCNKLIDERICDLDLTAEVVKVSTEVIKESGDRLESLRLRVNGLSADMANVLDDIQQLQRMPGQNFVTIENHTVRLKRLEEQLEDSDG